MRDILATIQAEQDGIIRAPLEGVVVVQGGPGTGKTAIGLHRASYLLYEHRVKLTRQRVLVVGPNRTFLKYISHVLPSLGETAVTQTTVAGLAPAVPVQGRDSMEAARVKGDARMAAVLARAVELRVEPISEDVELVVHSIPFTLPASLALDMLTAVAARGVPHNTGRDAVREQLITALYRRYARASGVVSEAGPYDSFARALRATP